MRQARQRGSRGVPRPWLAVAAAWARRLALCGVALGLAVQAGCASVNVGSAQRLSEQALGATQALRLGLDGVRADLATYVEGQALLAPLTQRPPLAPSELCALEAVQRSLRLRLMALGKLLLAYEHFRGLAVRAAWTAEEPVLDELFTELDPNDFPVDAPLATGCPAPSPLPARRDPALAPELVSPPRSLGLSQTRSLKVASARIRVLLGRLRAVLAAERATIESMQRQLVESQRRIALALLSRYDVVSPAPLLRPQLERLGRSERYIFRSSTNAEDLAGFNGAGLYESVVVPGDASNEVIANALRRVWASVWLQRAYEEREWFRIEHDAVCLRVGRIRRWERRPSELSTSELTDVDVKVVSRAGAEGVLHLQLRRGVGPDVHPRRVVGDVVAGKRELPASRGVGAVHDTA